MKHSPGSDWNLIDSASTSAERTVFVSSDECFAVHFYDINEYGMLKFASPIRIWKDKSKPSILFDSAKIAFEYQFDRSIGYLPNYKILCLLFPKISNTRIDIINVLIDLPNASYATLDVFNYDISENSLGEVVLLFKPRYVLNSEELALASCRDGEVLNLRFLNWTSLRRMKF